MPNPTKPTIPPLEERALLTEMHTSGWKGRAPDLDLARELAEQTGAKKSFCRFSKRLLACPQFRGIQSAEVAIRKAHYKYTLPWDSARIIPCRSLEGLTSIVWRRIADLQERVQTYVTFTEDGIARAGGQYAVDRERAKDDLGPLWKAEDYPSPEEFANSYNAVLLYRPVPAIHHIPTALGPTYATVVAETLKAHTEQCLTDAWQTLLKRLLVPLRRMVEVLGRPSDTHGGFRRAGISTITNVAEAAQIAQTLILEPHPRLESILQAMIELGQTSPDIRSSQPLRLETAHRASVLIVSITKLQPPGGNR